MSGTGNKSGIRFRLQNAWHHSPVVLCAVLFAWSATAVWSYRRAQSPSGKIVLRMGHWQLEASVRDALDELAVEYAKLHPNVKIIQEAVPEGVYGQWVTTQLLGGTAPDILEVGLGLPSHTWIQFYNRYFCSVRNLIDRPNPYNKGTPLENVPLRQTYKDGMRSSYIEELQEYVSVPLSMNGVRIFYNEDLLRKLTGFIKPPQDYRGFLAACERIHSKRLPTGQPYTPIACSRYHLGKWEDLFFNPITYGALRYADFNRDGAVAKDEMYVAVKTERLSVGSPYLRARFSMFQEVSRFFQPGYMGLTRDEAVFLFAQQKAVFISSGTWELRGLEQQAAGKFNVGVMDFPYPTRADPEFGNLIEGPRYEAPGGGFPFGVTRTCRHPEAARDFLLFLAGRKQNERLNQIVSWIPVIVGTQMDPKLEAFEPHLRGVYPAIDLALGSETYIKWFQLTLLFQSGQITFDNMLRQFEPFYKERGYRDYLEMTRDWRQAPARDEVLLAGFRGRALTAAGNEADALWMKYRALVPLRQVWPEIQRNLSLHLLEKGPDCENRLPYEHAPRVWERIRKTQGNRTGAFSGQK